MAEQFKYGRGYWKVMRTTFSRPAFPRVYHVHPRHAITVNGQLVTSGGNGLWVVAASQVQAIRGVRKRLVKR